MEGVAFDTLEVLMYNQHMRELEIVNGGIAYCESVLKKALVCSQRVEWEGHLSVLKSRRAELEVLILELLTITV